MNKIVGGALLAVVIAGGMFLGYKAIEKWA